MSSLSDLWQSGWVIPSPDYGVERLPDGRVIVHSKAVPTETCPPSTCPPSDAPHTLQVSFNFESYLSSNSNCDGSNDGGVFFPVTIYGSGSSGSISLDGNWLNNIYVNPPVCYVWTGTIAGAISYSCPGGCGSGAGGLNVNFYLKKICGLWYLETDLFADSASCGDQYKFAQFINDSPGVLITGPILGTHNLTIYNGADFCNITLVLS